MKRKTGGRKAAAAKSFLTMTPQQRTAAVARFDGGVSFGETRPLSPKGKVLWQRAKRARGRPAKPPRQKAARVLITLEPGLLSLADSYARRRAISRSELIADALRRMMDSMRKTA